VKIYKLVLAILFLAVAITLAIYATEIKESLFGSSSPPETAQSPTENPLPKPQAEAQPGAINQLLQQNPESSPGIPASDTASDTDADDMETLQEALNDFYSSADEQDREAALMTLGEYPDPKAKEAILYALNDPEDSVREQAVSQISSWEDEKERQQMLLTAMSNDKPDIVVLALESISEIEDPALMQKIKDLSNDKNEDVAEAAKTALEMAEVQ